MIYTVKCDDHSDDDLNFVKKIKFDDENRFVCLLGLLKFTLINLTTKKARTFSIKKVSYEQICDLTLLTSLCEHTGKVEITNCFLACKRP